MCAIDGFYSMKFWKTEVEEVLEDWRKGQGALQAWSQRAADAFIPIEPGSKRKAPISGGQDDDYDGGGKKKKRPRRNATRKVRQDGYEDQSDNQQSAQECREFINERHADGRFKRNTNGTDYCPDYAKGGCDTICKHDPKKAHGCEWCRGQHPTSSCRINKGNGKGNKAGKADKKQYIGKGGKGKGGRGKFNGKFFTGRG